MTVTNTNTPNNQDAWAVPPWCSWLPPAIGRDGKPHRGTVAYCCQYFRARLEAAEQQAEVVVPESVMKLITKYPPNHFSNRDHFENTVKKAAIRLVIDRYYRGRGTWAADLGEHDPPAPPAEEHVWTDDAMPALQRVWLRLDQYGRFLLRLKVVELWTFKQLADLFLPDVPNSSTAIGQIRATILTTAQHARELILADQYGTN